MELKFVLLVDGEIFLTICTDIAIGN
ncbi:hypothetical protein CCACVL1_00702 [Corchorus capsularis]|uniref:Uncharacterized protein n=1 Tax=Corchorus capsularis TaxID=210143 RepID=A0A1R3KVH8_COCAP|nr:hypothetical protein CCACVL1_00702 [Corchorus capsularis]